MACTRYESFTQWYLYLTPLHVILPTYLTEQWFFLLLLFLKIFCDNKSPFCGATGTLCFGLRMTLPTGFKTKVDPSSATLCSCLCIMTLLIPRPVPDPNFYTLVWWGYCWSVCPMSLSGWLAVSTPSPHGPKPMLYWLSYPGRRWFFL